MKTSGKMHISRHEDVSRKPHLDAWIKLTEMLGEAGGFLHQAEGYRVQFKRTWVEAIAPFADQQWWAWVPGELCCRFVPDCAKAIFQNDVKRWSACPAHEHIPMPSGDVPVKCKYERRGRFTIPTTIAAAAGIAPGRLLHVVARRGFIDIWIPEAFTAYCARIAQPAAGGDSRSSRAVPSNTGVSPIQPN